MSLRKVVSLTCLLSFVVVLLTSVILYIEPHGRVAYWSDWRLWSLSKDQWGAIHINLGTVFIIMLIWHVYYNWTPIVNYLKDKARQLKVFTLEFNVALVLVVVCTIGTYVEMPPFSSFMHLNESIKDAGSLKYGEPPYGHAELSSFLSFAKKADIDPTAAMALLKKAGYTVDESGQQSLLEIAKANSVTPQQVYLMMKPATRALEPGQVMPKNPAPGTGNQTLKDLCNTYDLNMASIISSLKKAGITVEENMTVKDIGKAHQMSPADVYDQIRALTGS